MKPFIACVVLVAAAIIGIVYQSPPYRLNRSVQPCDQQAFAHRDSAYSSSTWVASPSENFFQLRFFDRVEGGVCLRPSWADIRALADKDARLAHLNTSAPEAPLPGEPTWTYEWRPDPGSLSNTKYVNLFPAAVLLNEHIMTEAEAGVPGDPEAWRRAKPNILVVGLGSGVGIAVFAHHFPLASITVVDIDQVVIDMVRDHFPLLRWLETQKLPDGRRRLQLVTRDARQFIRAHDVSDQPKYDLIVLDAYTSGSTIPPHLMTRQFYHECLLALNTGGIVMSNIIGAYEKPPHGNKHLVLGGAIRSQLKAGLTHVHNIPIMQKPASEPFVATDTRNNLVLASTAPIGPRGNPAGWKRLKTFVPYPELKRGELAYSSAYLFVMDSQSRTSAYAPLDFVKESSIGWLSKLSPYREPMFGDLRLTGDRAIIDEVTRGVRAACAQRKIDTPVGWEEDAQPTTLFCQRMDWVEHTREVWNAAVEKSNDVISHDGENLVGPGGKIEMAPEFTDELPNADIYNGG